MDAKTDTKDYIFLRKDDPPYLTVFTIYYILILFNVEIVDILAEIVAFIEDLYDMISS